MARKATNSPARKGTRKSTPQPPRRRKASPTQVVALLLNGVLRLRGEQTQTPDRVRTDKDGKERTLPNSTESTDANGVVQEHPHSHGEWTGTIAAVLRTSQFAHLLPDTDYPAYALIVQAIEDGLIEGRLWEADDGTIRSGKVVYAKGHSPAPRSRENARAADLAAGVSDLLKQYTF